MGGYSFCSLNLPAVKRLFFVIYEVFLLITMALYRQEDNYLGKF